MDYVDISVTEEQYYQSLISSLILVYINHYHLQLNIKRQTIFFLERRQISHIPEKGPE
jgi:hypothetical protein